MGDEGRWGKLPPGCGAGAKPLWGGSGAAGFVEGRGSARLCWWEPAQVDGGTATAFGLGAEGCGRAWGTCRRCPRGKQLRVPTRGGMASHAVPRGSNVFAAGRAAAWPGQHCDAREHFGPPAPRELQPQRHRAAPVGFRVDFGHWDVIVGMAASDSVGCSSSLGEGVGGASAAPCTLPEVAAGRRATLVMQEKEISRSRMTPRSWAAASLSPPSLSPSTGRPAPVPPCRGAAGRQGAGAGWAAVPAPGSREPRNLSAYKSLIS